MVRQLQTLQWKTSETMIDKLPEFETLAKGTKRIHISAQAQLIVETDPPPPANRHDSFNIKRGMTTSWRMFTQEIKKNDKI